MKFSSGLQKILNEFKFRFLSYGKYNIAARRRRAPRCRGGANFKSMHA